MKHLFAWLTLCAVLPACHKGQPAAPDECPSITGITPRDVMGALMGTEDTTDWQRLDTWSTAVEELFAGRPAPPLASSVSDTLYSIGYPNPTPGHFRMDLERDSTPFMDVRVIDADCNLVLMVDSITSALYQLDEDSLDLSPGERLRVYYRIVHSDGTAHQGHGDVQGAP